MKVYVLIEGLVQGVSFRAFVKEYADRLNIKGWVRNTTDGTVEAIFTGNKQSVQKIIQICKQGPPMADVKEVVVKPEKERKEFESFEILR